MLRKTTVRRSTIPRSLFLVTCPVFLKWSFLCRWSHLLERHPELRSFSSELSACQKPHVVLQVWCILSVKSVTPALPFGDSERCLLSHQYIYIYTHHRAVFGAFFPSSTGSVSLGESLGLKRCHTGALVVQNLWTGKMPCLFAVEIGE